MAGAEAEFCALSAPAESQGSDHPQVPLSSYMGTQGRNHGSGSEIPKPFREPGRKTLNVSFPGTQIKRGEGKEVNTGDRKTSGRVGEAQGGGTSGQVGRLPRSWERVSGKECQAASSIGRSR